MHHGTLSEGIHLEVAVAAPEGLIVPVIRRAERPLRDTA
jgi:pyruvate/2-oxoglutarate dehydrogenase complex dihydrolipoamide acyltransferase (E2) component